MATAQNYRSADRRLCLVDAGDDGHTPVGHFLKLLLMIKGFTPSFAAIPDSQLKPALVCRGIQIEGFWPATHWVLETTPYPELMPETPERRAVVSSLVEIVLLKPAETLAAIASLYDRSPFASTKLTLLDVAVVAAAHAYPNLDTTWCDATTAHVTAAAKNPENLI